MLDENTNFQMIALKPSDPKPIWFNMVPDINQTYSRAIKDGCTKVQPITEMMDYNVSNAMFSDVFGYICMLHQVYKEVSFEERIKLWEESRK